MIASRPSGPHRRPCLTGSSKIAALTEGLSLAHVKEIITSSEILQQETIEEAIARLRSNVAAAAEETSDDDDDDDDNDNE
jgi:hypothetical protein